MSDRGEGPHRPDGDLRAEGRTPVRAADVVRMAKRGPRHRSIAVVFFFGALLSVCAVAVVPAALRLGVAVVAAVGMCLGGVILLATRTVGSVAAEDREMHGGAKASDLPSEYERP